MPLSLLALARSDLSRLALRVLVLVINVIAVLHAVVLTAHIPRIMRPLVIWVWACIARIRLYEAPCPSGTYPALGAFTSRRVKPRHTRGGESDLTAPVDGKVLALGSLNNEGWRVVYRHPSLHSARIRGGTRATGGLKDRPRDEITARVGRGVSVDRGIGGCDVRDFLLINLAETESHRMYYVTMCIPICDSTCVYAPADCVMRRRTHIPGAKLPMGLSECVAQWWDRTGMPSPLVLNERMVLEGHWQCGRLWLVPVLTLTSGPVSIDFDPSLRTNIAGSAFTTRQDDEHFEHRTCNNASVRVRVKHYGGAEGASDDGVRLRRGEMIGHFMGSGVVVVVFEQIDGCMFTVDAPQYVLYGTPLTDNEETREEG